MTPVDGRRFDVQGRPLILASDFDGVPAGTELWCIEEEIDFLGNGGRIGMHMRLPDGTTRWWRAPQSDDEPRATFYYGDEGDEDAIEFLCVLVNELPAPSSVSESEAS